MGWLRKAANIVSLGSFDGAKGLWDDFTGKTAVDKQNEYNLQMWNMQNEYNTPANQMKRYLEAGLNPNLIYGQGTPGNASSAPDMQAHQGSVNKLLGLLSSVVSLKGQVQGQQLEKVKTLAGIEHSKQALDFERQKFLIDNAFRDLDFQLREKEFGHRVSSSDRDFNLAKERWQFERDHINRYGTKPGTTMDWLNRLMSGTMGKSTTDVATDTNNLLKAFFQKSFFNLFDLGGLNSSMRDLNRQLMDVGFINFK